MDQPHTSTLVSGLLYCSRCGEQVDRASRFCHRCGAAVHADAGAATEAPFAPTPPGPQGSTPGGAVAAQLLARLLEPVVVGVALLSLLVSTAWFARELHVTGALSGLLPTPQHRGSSFPAWTNVTVGADGGVYVVDSGEMRVLQFSATGSQSSSIPLDGSGAVIFTQPEAIRSDRQGNIYVSFH